MRQKCKVYNLIIPFLLLMISLAHAEIFYVDDDNPCPGTGTMNDPFCEIQLAVDTASDGDIIKVASGTYSEVNNYGGLKQIVYIEKSVTIKGGYFSDFSEPPDPQSNVTEIDAKGEGRAFYITGNISPTIEGFYITGGNASGLGGSEWGDAGGGVYISKATATIRNNNIFNNIASVGGGIYLDHSNSTINNNVIFNNTANQDGGGLLIYYGNPTIADNTINENYAKFNGGGLDLHYTSAVIVNNDITENDTGWGGGLAVYFSSAIIKNNNILNNKADREGAGIFVCRCSPEIIKNTIKNNTIYSTYGYSGGGIEIEYGGGKIDGNIISENSAYVAGGIELDHSSPIISNNVIINNMASSSGGGIRMYVCSPTLKNNIIADNQASTGSGLDIIGSSPNLLHNTIARNDGNNGIYISKVCSLYSNVKLINTILVGHKIGIYVTSGNEATLEATLWGTGDWANEADYAGDGSIDTGLYNYWTDPMFLNPDAGDYHISEGSGARDNGIDAGVDTDIDGESRPYGKGYDIGADEWMPPLCEGDFDGDSDVDGSDLAIFAADFGRTDCNQPSVLPCEGDFDGDGDVDGSDLAIFAEDFGRTDCPCWKKVR